MMARVLTENGDVRALDWRRETLEREFGPEFAHEAAVLAMSDSDLHDIMDSFERGCTPKLLVLIYG